MKWPDSDWSQTPVGGNVIRGKATTLQKNQYDGPVLRAVEGCSTASNVCTLRQGSCHNWKNLSVTVFTALGECAGLTDCIDSQHGF